ncbi:MAG: 4-phosphoerythronate dehydrogenase [Planctomycetota bacterium]
MKTIADENIPFVKECFSSIGDVDAVSGRGMEQSILKNADVLLVRSITKVNEKLLDGTRIKFVGTATIGDEHIDKTFLESRGIGFASAPGSNANSVAEYIVATLLSIARKKKINLEGKSIGVVGVGHIGSLVEKKVQALGMQPVLNDPPLQRQTSDDKFRPIQELFDCDFVSLHVPLTYEGDDKTYHMANDKFFNSLKRKCVFINTSRGGVVETKSLKSAINNDKLKAAILDVWENEPDIDYELLRNVDLGTPHIAGYSLDGKVNGMIMIYDAVCKYFGLSSDLNISSFLPDVEEAEVKVDHGDKDQQHVLHETVQEVYAINRDDFNMREILMVPDQQRGEFFDDLRKNYSVRREFQNTRIILDKPCEGLVKKLVGIGFKV